MVRGLVAFFVLHFVIWHLPTWAVIGWLELALGTFLLGLVVDTVQAELGVTPRLSAVIAREWARSRDGSGEAKEP